MLPTASGRREGARLQTAMLCRMLSTGLGIPDGNAHSSSGKRITCSLTGINLFPKDTHTHTNPVSSCCEFFSSSAITRIVCNGRFYTLMSNCRQNWRRSGIIFSQQPVGMFTISLNMLPCGYTCVFALSVFKFHL